MIRFLFTFLIGSLCIWNAFAKEEVWEDEDEEEEVETNEKESLVYCYRSEKLNLSGFFQERDSAKKDSQKIIFHNLLRILYGNQPLFSVGDNSDDVVNLFKEVEQRAEEISKKMFFVKVTDLTLISLRDDPDIQNLKQSVYSHILKGGRGEFIFGHRCRLESLGKYINLNNSAEGILNVYFAPKTLLLALFQQESIANEVIQYRSELWNMLREEKKLDKKVLEEKFRQKFVSSIPSSIDAKFIDFRIFAVARE
jgi:hypothetical protein